MRYGKLNTLKGGAQLRHNYLFIVTCLLPQQQNVLTAADVNSKKPLPVFDMLPYQVIDKIARCSYLYTFLLVCFIIGETWHSLWLTGLENEFFDQSTMKTNFIVWVTVRLLVRVYIPLLFTYKLFGHHITSIPKSLASHKLLHLLGGNPEYLVDLHKGHSLPGEVAIMENQIDITQYTINVLYSPLKWLMLASVTYSAFLPLFLYKTGGLSYEYYSPSNSTVSTYMPAWDGFSLFTSLVMVSIAFSFFVYEYRLIRYAQVLVTKGDDIGEITRDICIKIHDRWRWLLHHSVFTFVLLATLLLVHWLQNIPLATSCMPLPPGATPQQWLSCILFLFVAAALTFWNIDNMLRAAKRAVCLTCLVIILLHYSVLESFLGTEKVNLHLLLFLIPLIVLFGIFWTFAHSHFVASKYQNAESQHTFLCFLNVVLVAMTALALAISTISEYKFISTTRNGTYGSACGNTTFIPEPPHTSAELNDIHYLSFQTMTYPSPGQEHSSRLHEAPAPSEITPPNSMSQILTSPPLPPTCHFDQGYYNLQLRVDVMQNLIIAHLMYRVIHSYNLESNSLIPCPRHGNYVVIYICSKTLQLKQVCSNRDFHLEKRYPWRDVFNLIAIMCIHIVPAE